MCARARACVELDAVKNTHDQRQPRHSRPHRHPRPHLLQDEAPRALRLDEVPQRLFHGQRAAAARPHLPRLHAAAEVQVLHWGSGRYGSARAVHICTGCRHVCGPPTEANVEHLHKPPRARPRRAGGRALACCPIPPSARACTLQRLAPALRFSAELTAASAADICGGRPRQRQRRLAAVGAFGTGATGPERVPGRGATYGAAPVA